MDARSDIPVDWLVNRVKHPVEVDTQPTQSGKQPDDQQRQTYQLGDTISVTLDGIEVGRIVMREGLPPSQQPAE